MFWRISWPAHYEWAFFCFNRTQKAEFFKRETDVSDLSEINRTNNSAPAIRYIRYIRFLLFPYHLCVSCSEIKTLRLCVLFKNSHKGHNVSFLSKKSFFVLFFFEKMIHRYDFFCNFAPCKIRYIRTLSEFLKR